ncbi:MAG TPA: bifunctional riboflavin kinase/FAD synthetase [Candidatus Binatia bacterium]
MMEVLRHLDSPISIPRPVLMLGNFDGVHLGHQALIGSAVADAKESGGRAVVFTFEPHPLKVLAPDRAPRLILTEADKLALLEFYGAETVIVQKFDMEFAHVEAEKFVDEYLVRRIGVRKVWVGKDLRFGRARKGRVEDLIRWGQQRGFGVGVVGPIEIDGHRVSSSRVRALIERGQMRQAAQYLGRFHFLSGRVIPGHGRGRDMGFPTANLEPETEAVPLDGIYATILEVGGRRWQSATSIGVNPTFGAGPRTIESYVFDFDGDLYGSDVKLYFIERIREEKTFPSPESLAQQIEQDVANVREILRATNFTAMPPNRGSTA